MHSSLTAAVLCIFAQVAAAECVVSAQAQGVEMVKTANIAAPPAATRISGELIKTAAAGTREAHPVAAVREQRRAEADEEHPPRSGTAMLLAALALMSGIALRRYTANKQ